VIISTLAIYYTTLIRAEPIKAEEDQRKDGENNEQDGGILGAIKSIFDPNEKTKSGKVLPKAYLNTAREVVKTLRESLEEDTNNIAKFRRSADAAKESIREYLSGWRGQKTVAGEVTEIYLHMFLTILVLAKQKVQSQLGLFFFFLSGVIRCTGESNKIPGRILLKSRAISITVK
jgi:Photosystem II Pbs27